MAQYNTPWWKRFLGHLLLPGLYSWFQKDTEGKSGWQNFKENISGMVSDSGVGNYVKSAADTLTGAHLTGSQVEANEMQMQNQEDIFGRQVAGMQKAGLNPALMYDNGIGSAPAVQGSQGTGSMSDLMSLIMLPLNKKLLKAQIGNIEADTQKKGAETKNIETLTPAQYEELVSKIKLNNKGLDEADARIAADLAQAALASKNTEWYDRLSQSEVDYRSAMSDLASAQEAHNRKQIDEIEAKIQGIKQDIVESMSRCVVNAAQAGYLDQATCNLMEEQGLIEIRRAGERVEYLINDKILRNYDTDKWFIRFQQGTAGIRDIGLGIGSAYSGGLLNGPTRKIGYK